MGLKITCLAPESRIQVLSEELKHEMLNCICSFIYSKEVLPLDVPIKHISTFQEFCQFCIFPFLTISKANPSLKPDENTYRTTDLTVDQQHLRQIVWQGRASGLLKMPAIIKFLGTRCHVSMHHIKDTTCRLSLTAMDLQRNYTLLIDLQIDKELFEVAFISKARDQFKQDSKPVDIKPNETFISSYELADA